MERKKERSLVLVKPDGVQRSLIGEIIKRYERTGLRLVGLKFLVPTEEMVEGHYLIEDGWLEGTGMNTLNTYKEKGQKPPFEDPVECGRWILDKNKKFLISGPVVAMVWQGSDAAGIVKKITGATQPVVADVGTIRGDFTIDSYPLADE
ncbi:nucleoside-diphosphate kinase, partial [Patescibacteria group bacterium]